MKKFNKYFSIHFSISIHLIFSSFLLGSEPNKSLDDKPYNEVTFVTAHNAYASIAEGWMPLWGANQRESLSDQMKGGVNALMLDIWPYQPKGGELDIYLWHNDPNSAIAYFFGLANLKMRTLQSGLMDVVNHLKKNPQAMMTIIFESHVSKGGASADEALRRSLEESKALQYAFHPHQLSHESVKGQVEWNVKTQGWPTLRWFKEHDLRLVMFTSERSNLRSEGGKTPQGLAYMWDYAIENVWGSPGLDPSFYTDPRRESRQSIEELPLTCAYPLVIMNHFPTIPLNFEEDPENESLESIRTHMIKMIKRYGKRPNFIATNYTLGRRGPIDRSLVRFVERMNRS